MLSMIVLQAIAAINNIVAANFSEGLSEVRRKNIGRSETMIELFFFPKSEEDFSRAQSQVSGIVMDMVGIKHSVREEKIYQLFAGTLPEGFKYTPSQTGFLVIMVYFNFPEERNHNGYRV